MRLDRRKGPAAQHGIERIETAPGQRDDGVCDQLLVGQLSREIRPVQRLVSGQKSAKNPTTSPQAVLVGGVDQLITRVMGGAYCRVRYGDGYRLSCKSS